MESQRLRVAVLNRLFKPTAGGAERYSIALVEQLASQHEIHVFAQEISHQFPGVTYHRVPLPFRRPRWINQLWFATATWWQTRKSYDVVHSHENTWHGNVQTVHVLPVQYNLFVGRTGLRRALRWIKVATSPRLLTYLGLEHLRYSVSDGRCIVLPSTSLKATMLKTFPRTQAALRIVTPGIAEVAGLASDALKRQARAALGLPVEGYCILLVGNDFRKKGLPALLAALKRLPADCYVAVVGNPAQTSFVESDIARLGLKERVFFLGAMASVQPAYHAADCLAHPTLEDTFAMVVLEAMACGLPVVVSSAQYCGISELLTDGENALLLNKPLDSDALAHLLERVRQDADVRTKLSGGALVFAAQHLWSQQAMRLDAIYRGVKELGA
ncbi:MAG: glycosyl transferase family 1 [Burkholderiales bacterium PBB3]|nr:MAG: glycosyl transferase family 1 [Burkholderiales bacterium PBB3]